MAQENSTSNSFSTATFWNATECQMHCQPIQQENEGKKRNNHQTINVPATHSQLPTNNNRDCQIASSNYNIANSNNKLTAEADAASATMSIVRH
ncbi:unnamed protein product [Ceratitis capitata]|uniref:(Mediterranean fruit fly) hypothetical protein n=1 Tax=Ceratitis capitata TaxID=7213 RepID=A0A811VEZ3_CERCA|nr:unnamed protein product [Ceratitis capitata]